MSAKKIGRPVVGSLKNIDIKVRIDEETNQRLLEYCEKNNTKRAEAIRCAIQDMLDKQK